MSIGHLPSVILAIDISGSGNDQIGKDECDCVAKADAAIPENRSQRNIPDRAYERDQRYQRPNNWSRFTEWFEGSGRTLVPSSRNFGGHKRERVAEVDACPKPLRFGPSQQTMADKRARILVLVLPAS